MAHEMKAPRGKPNRPPVVIDLAVELRGFTDAENKPRRPEDSDNSLRRY